MPPADYKAARAEAVDERNNDKNAVHAAVVDGRPYFPTVRVDASDETSIKVAAACIVSHGRAERRDFDDDGTLTVKSVPGGICNAVFRVSGFRKRGGRSGASADLDFDFDSVLVRVFGAEGMIDRDVETSTYGALCDARIAYRYLGRFANGRVEGWLDGYRSLRKDDFSNEKISDAIAVQMAHLHTRFTVPDYLERYHDPSEPGMWSQLHSWMERAKNIEKFRTPGDDERSKDLNLEQIEREMAYLEEEVVPSNAAVAFCHNDLLAANIMVLLDDGENESSQEEKKEKDRKFIQLIDFEYGGVSYVSFDIANHFNEHAGGTDAVDNGVPNYDLFPSKERQMEFVTTYVRAAREGNGSNEEARSEESVDEEARSLIREIHTFVMANHLYWGLWGVNQAATEGCGDFDYLLYAANRFKQYFKCKEGDS